MEQKISGLDTFNLILTTAVLLGVGLLLVLLLFQYQRKKYLHYQEVRDLKDAFSKSLLQSKLEIQEQTLGHISRELHDNISPLISIIQLNLGTPRLKKITDIQPDLNELRANANQLMTELKSLSVTLNTDYIMHRGLMDALWEDLDRIERTKQLKTVRTITGEKYRLSPEHEILLFRICQEILNNIVKHAKATIIIVQIDYTPDQYKICITDNGIGFDPNNAEEENTSKKSTGLLNIQSRAKLINAEISIHSVPEKGTSTTITISPDNKPDPCQLQKNK